MKIVPGQILPLGPGFCLLDAQTVLCSEMTAISGTRQLRSGKSQTRIVGRSTETYILAR